MPAENKSVITRFAPSPTGFLHIGGARTALYNWLFARRHGGQFLLRIEDTDRKRSSDAAVEAILDGLTWLGLEWDGDAISQFARAERHSAIARTLVAKGHAYYCYASPDELQEAREKAMKAGGNFRGDIWRERDPSTAPKDIAPTLRLKMPRDGKRVINDQVQGRVEVENASLDDMVLLRSDGTPTYMLSVVVDDHDMGITHVIRGDDHLNNAFRQSALYEAFGWDQPVFAHIPLIHGPDGKKLSKRHGAMGVDAYRDMGYLPEALRNYLLRLGWSHGDDEFINSDQAIAWFNLESIGVSPSRFDFDKLDHINAHYLRLTEPHILLEQVTTPLSVQLNRPVKAHEKERLLKAMPGLTERSKRLVDLAEHASVFCDIRPISLNEKSVSQLTEEAKLHITALATKLEILDNWQEDTLKTYISQYCDANALKVGKLLPAIRAALTGGRPSGDLFEIMTILGADESLARIKDQAL